MTVDFAYRLMQYVVDKNQDGYLDPDQFTIAINQAQMSFLDYLLGESQQYRAGRPIPNVQWGQNETIRQTLTPLINSPLRLTINSQGVTHYPADFQQVDAMYSIYQDRIRFTSQDRLYSMLNSVIDPVSAAEPIYLIESTYLRFYPQSIGTAYMSYVKTPPTIVWNFTNSIYGQPQYNPVGSVDPVWYDSDMLDIITRALRIVGTNLQANQVSQYANEIKTQGQ